MTLRPCETCQAVTLDLTLTSAFLVGRSPVSYADLRTLAQKSTANVAVFYDVKTNAVTRIVVSDGR
jgi:hypothetical protein